MRVEPATRSDLIQLAHAARDYADAGMSPNSRRAYGSDWRDFASWCASVDARPLPADAATVAMYLTARAPTLRAATLARRLAAIRTAHRAADLPPPESGDLKRVWSGIRRQHARPARKKRALVTEDLKRVVAKIPDSLAGQRDRALLLVGFAGALRRSELAALTLEGELAGDVWCRFVSGGLELVLEKSKGDQEGEGAVVGVPFGRTKLCPVGALQAWLERANITAGAVFRPIDRHGRMGEGAMSDRAVADVVKSRVGAAGFDPSGFGGHSLRAGLITTAIANGVATDVVMRQSRHARYDTMRCYIRDGERFKRNAAGKVGL